MVSLVGHIGLYDLAGGLRYLTSVRSTKRVYPKMYQIILEERRLELDGQPKQNDSSKQKAFSPGNLVSKRSTKNHNRAAGRLKPLRKKNQTVNFPILLMGFSVCSRLVISNRLFCF